MFQLTEDLEQHQIGNKSLNLSILKKHNFNIADGFILTKNDIDNIDNIDLSKITFSKSAIRSAAIGEDSNLSFAGIFKSILNIKNSNLRNGIIEINKSFYSKKSEIYQQIKKTSIIPQILIQEMINSKYSAIIFISGTKIDISLVVGSCDIIANGSDTGLELSLFLNSAQSIEEQINDIKNPILNIIGLSDFIHSCLHIRNILNIENIDIETTFDGTKWWILQARKLNF